MITKEYLNKVQNLYQESGAMADRLVESTPEYHRKINDILNQYDEAISAFYYCYDYNQIPSESLQAKIRLFIKKINKVNLEFNI